MRSRKRLMRLDGDGMVVGLKDGFKLLGIFIISCCAVFVCTLFLNFNIDLAAIEGQITAGPAIALYQAQILTGKVISGVSGGCLLLTSVIMLFSYIKHYIDAHRKELGILKALGYSNWSIARGFWVFGLSVFLGSAAGFGSSFLLMPAFYRVQNGDNILPQAAVRFHVSLAVCFVILPGLLFALLSCLYAGRRLRRPALELLTEKTDAAGKGKEKGDKDRPFLRELKKSTVKGRKSLAFFITFACFCYSSMMQMSLSMDSLASKMFSVMLMAIGVILSCTTLFLAATAVVDSNKKTAAVMRAFGYSWKDCTGAVLNGYRPLACIGFVTGTAYQYGLMNAMINIVFRDIADVPYYTFDGRACIMTLFSFVLIYELVMYGYSRRIKRITIREIMSD